MSEPHEGRWLGPLALWGLTLGAWACVPGSSHRLAPSDGGWVRAQTEVVAPNPWGDEVRSLLAPECGGCHLPGRPTSVARALAVFNFMEEPWYGRMSAEQFGELGRRAQGSKTLTEPDKEKVAAFVRCAAGGACTVPGGATR